MFYHIQKMTQMTMKLLIRNKGFLFFAILLPVLATLILNTKNAGDSIVESTEIIELDSMDAQMAYLNDYTMFPVKVYDRSGSEAASLFLKHLAEEGIFQIYRINVTEMSEQEILESARKTAMQDKVGGILVINADYVQDILAGDLAAGVQCYKTGDDERYDLLVSAAETTSTLYGAYAKEASVQTETELEQAITQYEEERYRTEIQNCSNAEKDGITSLDVDYKSTEMMGYTQAIISLAFLFSGIMILATITTEKQNLVYTRILLSKADSGSYMVSKFMVILFSAVLQTIVTTIGYVILVRADLGVSIPQFALIVFLSALIFNSLSVTVGVCCGSVLPATYMSFFIWTVTALLGGLYFDITGSSELMQRIAMLMPQRWMLKTAQMFMAGNNFAYPMILTVTAGYLIVILVIGILGLKINRKE